MAKTCDVKCYALAEHFLQDHPALNLKTNAHDLALEIQEAIEGWFLDHTLQPLERQND
jgi:hypothetical protein